MRPARQDTPRNGLGWVNLRSLNGSTEGVGGTLANGPRFVNVLTLKVACCRHAHIPGPPCPHPLPPHTRLRRHTRAHISVTPTRPISVTPARARSVIPAPRRGYLAAVRTKPAPASPPPHAPPSVIPAPRRGYLAVVRTKPIPASPPPHAPFRHTRAPPRVSRRGGDQAHSRLPSLTRPFRHSCAGRNDGRGAGMMERGAGAMKRLGCRARRDTRGKRGYDGSGV